MSRETENLRSTHAQLNPEGHDIDLEAEHRADVARRVSLAGLRREVQRRATGAAAATEAVHDAAAHGIASPTTALPHAGQIQASFGPGHDVSGIQAHLGGDAAAAMGATAYASGNHVVFDRPPDLHTAAHEAAHVVQQAHGVNLYGGVGEAGDAYERHADAVADRVVAGQSATDLLGAPTMGTDSAFGAVQRKAEAKVSDATVDERRDQYVVANTAGAKASHTTIRFATRELILLAEQITKILETPPDEAGMDRQLRAIEDVFATGSETIHRLSMELGLANKGRIPEGDEMERDLYAFSRGYAAFTNAVGRAQNFASKDPQQRLNVQPNFLKPEVDKIFADRHLRVPDLTEKWADSEVDGHGALGHAEPTGQLLVGALDANLEATIQTAHLVRMRIGSASDEQLVENAGRVIAHVIELASLLGHADARTVRRHHAAIAKAVHEVQLLQQDSAPKPQLADRMHSGTFSEALRRIHARIAR